MRKKKECSFLNYLSFMSLFSNSIMGAYIDVMLAACVIDLLLLLLFLQCSWRMNIHIGQCTRQTKRVNRCFDVSQMFWCITDVWKASWMPINRFVGTYTPDFCITEKIHGGISGEVTGEAISMGSKYRHFLWISINLE